MQLTIKKNTLNATIRSFLMASDGSGCKKGLTVSSKDFSVAYIREGDTHPTPVTLVQWNDDKLQPGAFREIDAHAMPGLYELVIPEAITAPGANRATLMFQAPGINTQVVHIDLVAYDPYDSYRLGLDCLSREGRHAVISRAFREVVPEIVEEFLRKSRMDAD